jgi:hypothetical protein
VDQEDLGVAPEVVGNVPFKWFKMFKQFKLFEEPGFRVRFDDLNDLNYWNDLNEESD